VAISASSPAAVPVAADDRDERIQALFEQNYRGLSRLAYLIVGDSVQAEEIVMDAFLRTFASWRRIRDLDRADAYLRRAVVNLSRTRVRRKRTEERSAPTGGVATTGWNVESHEAARQIWDAVRSLPHRQRAAVILRYYQDLPEAEIAAALKCSVGTVKSQLSKARASLSRALEDEGDES
jgi:RNA polymerase sigma-70 factor (sigma-E family)